MLRPGLLLTLVTFGGPTPGVAHFKAAPGFPAAMATTGQDSAGRALPAPGAGVPLTWDGLRAPLSGAMPDGDICSAIRGAGDARGLVVDPEHILSALRAQGLCPRDAD